MNRQSESTLWGVGAGWLLCHSHCFTAHHASQKMVERTGRKGKAECINSENPTKIHCTQAQEQWEAARCANAYLYSFKYTIGSSRNVSDSIS